MHIDDLIEDRAKKGDGLYAIAYALLKAANAQERMAREIRDLGNAGAMGPFGAIEGLGMQIEKAAQIVADAIPQPEE